MFLLRIDLPANDQPTDIPSLFVSFPFSVLYADIRTLSLPIFVRYNSVVRSRANVDSGQFLRVFFESTRPNLRRLRINFERLTKDREQNINLQITFAF